MHADLEVSATNADLEVGATARVSVAVGEGRPGAEVLGAGEEVPLRAVAAAVGDDDKHYWVDESEVDNLVAKGEGWLESHPARDTIVRRSLKHKGRLARIRRSRSRLPVLGAVT